MILNLSLRAADAFPVVASLRERSDDRKYVCCSQAISTLGPPVPLSRQGLSTSWSSPAKRERRFWVVSDTRQPKVSPFLCFDATKFVLLCVFTLAEMICLNICSISRLKTAKVHFRLTLVAQKRRCLNSLLPNF